MELIVKISCGMIASFNLVMNLFRLANVTRTAKMKADLKKLQKKTGAARVCSGRPIFYTTYNDLMVSSIKSI